VLVYTSVIFVAEAVVLGLAGGTFVASLEATVKIKVSPAPDINASKLKFKAASLQVATVWLVTTGSGFTVTATINAIPIQPVELIGVTVYEIITGAVVVLVYTSVIFVAEAVVLGLAGGTFVASLEATV
jgi:uncharacterized protein YneF (UPF0154 family)